MSHPNDPQPSAEATLGDARVHVVGAGRMGAALARNLRAAGVEVNGPLGRGARGEGADIVLLAVPDAEIAAAAAALVPGPLVGHLSGATGLEPLRPHRAFSMHPLTSVAGAAHDFRGEYAAVDGSSAESLQSAEILARSLGMRTFRVRDRDRAAYHAAASIAANFLVTLEGAAEELAATAGVGREALLPLVRAAVENWAARGAAAALTGPIARGDAATVTMQRQAVADRVPQHLELFDVLAGATSRLAQQQGGSA